MAFSLRSRLLLLVLSVLLPALAGALWVIVSTYRAEGDALDQVVHDNASALAMVVDRELTQRAAIARALASSPLLETSPRPEPEQLAAFERQARHVMAGLAGWVELRSGDEVLLSTRPAAATAPPAPGSGPALADSAKLQPMARAAGTPWHATVVEPVHQDGQVVLNLAVTILPQELQGILDKHRLPPDWIATVMDQSGTVVARQPGGFSFVGRPGSDSLREQMRGRTEGTFEGTSLDGRSVRGHFAQASQGWTFLVAVPRDRFAASGRDAVAGLLLGGLVLLGLAVGGALWLSRRIARPAAALQGMAARMQRSEPVRAAPTGIAEFDQVAQALAEASRTLSASHEELERRVAQAVARTRDAEQRASQGQRVEALGRLTGGVAHDVNNLLGVISNSAYLIERRAGAAEEMQSPLGAIRRAVESGRRLTQHLLRFAGRHATRPERVDLVSTAPEWQELLAIVLGKRVQVQLQVEPGTPPVVVDPGELELALINLALNARDALHNAPAGRGHVVLEMRRADPADHPGLPPGEHVQITLTDDGCGLDDEVARRAFEPFFTTKPMGSGSGLGLAQVHGFCTEAGGQVRIAGAPGLGTAVTLLLPAAPAATAAASPAAAAAPAGGADLAGLRVLLVDDNASLGEVTSAVLGAHGAAVTPALSAEQALSLMDGGSRFDAVLSDIVMPGGMDGVALARTLRERFPRLPVVLITGYSHIRLPSGEFPVLHKPCSPGELVQALQQAARG
ncbi:ATP-binding protein [Ideonella sp.]|uniref:ATP-binding protein n=1 Tax=Ideonella sp. TaxID=1929293 RepID=UPI0035AEC3E6